MSEETNIYGEGLGKPIEIPKQEEAKQEEKTTYPLRLYFTGGSADILSPMPKEQFLVDLISEVTSRGSDPTWSGWFGFRVKPKTKGSKSSKTISVMVKQIVGVEEL